MQEVRILRMPTEKMLQRLRTSQLRNKRKLNQMHLKVMRAREIKGSRTKMK